MSKKSTIARELLSSPRARRGAVKLISNPRVRRGAIWLAKNPRVRRMLFKQATRRLRRR